MSDTQRDREERQHVIEVLQNMVDWMQEIDDIATPERIHALFYAIASIKTDLKYDLLYEETSGQADKPTTKNDLGVASGLEKNSKKLENPTTKDNLGVDCISRKAVQTRLKEIINEMETIFADIREREVNDSVCGLCEYDYDHGIDGFANECPGFEKDDCFKLKEKYRAEWLDISNMPSVTPQKPRKITLEDVKGYCEPRSLTIISNELLYELTHPKIKALEQESASTQEYGLTDADTDKYAVQVQNGEGYYNSFGRYVSYDLD